MVWPPSLASMPGTREAGSGSQQGKQSFLKLQQRALASGLPRTKWAYGGQLGAILSLAKCCQGSRGSSDAHGAKGDATLGSGVLWWERAWTPLLGPSAFLPTHWPHRALVVAKREGLSSVYEQLRRVLALLILFCLNA